MFVDFNKKAKEMSVSEMAEYIRAEVRESKGFSIQSYSSYGSARLFAELIELAELGRKSLQDAPKASLPINQCVKETGMDY